MECVLWGAQTISVAHMATVWGFKELFCYLSINFSESSSHGTSVVWCQKEHNRPYLACRLHCDNVAGEVLLQTFGPLQFCSVEDRKSTGRNKSDPSFFLPYLSQDWNKSDPSFFLPYFSQDRNKPDLSFSLAYLSVRTSYGRWRIKLQEALHDSEVCD